MHGECNEGDYKMYITPEMFESLESGNGLSSSSLVVNDPIQLVNMKTLFDWTSVHNFFATPNEFCWRDLG